MRQSWLLAVLRKRIDAVSKGEETLVDVDAFSFPQRILVIEFLAACEIDDEEFAACLLSLPGDLHAHLEDGMRAG
jgi:hypothetical protein